MKFRMDFVTNSSSSSFTLNLKIKLKNGEELVYWGYGNGDDGSINARLYPKEMGQQKSIKDLIQLLRKSVITYEFEEEVWPFDTDDYSKSDYEDEEMYRASARYFLKKLTEVEKMEDIQNIEVTGTEEYANGLDSHVEVWTYDMGSGKATCKAQGEKVEDYDGAPGGSLNNPFWGDGYEDPKKWID